MNRQAQVSKLGTTSHNKAQNKILQRKDKKKHESSHTMLF